MGRGNCKPWFVSSLLLQESPTLQVQIAACDTFRSGAVEQLRTHCNRLSIPLYERGYEKDPAKVAYEAIKSAERNKIDVLLVDTAGKPSVCVHSSSAM